jgi:glutamate-ammonia-ligase adenylyltransferase
MITPTTSDPNGHRILSNLRELSEYSPKQIRQVTATWPAVARYLQILKLKATDPADELRQKRHHAWLRCAIATWFNTATTEDVCAYWSQQAAMLLRSAWQASGLNDLPIALFALGKLGANELNLSSDVDLLVVRTDHSDVGFRHLRPLQTLLAEVTAFGFCLRLDFDLRPGGKAGSPVPSQSEFENYYGYYGETWERLALVRLQPICGDTQISQSILETAHRFSYRRHLDYTLLEDLKLLRPRIHNSFRPSQQNEFNIKLGIGGIRDIELFIHALQVVHGGKNSQLRSPNTSESVRQLVAHQIYPAADAQFLIDTYWHYRHIENRLQARDDQQTYIFAKADEPALGLNGEFTSLGTQTAKVDSTVSQLLGRADSTRALLPTHLEDQQSWLRDLGFSDYAVTIIWPELINATALSRQPERDERSRLQFLQAFVEELNKIKLDPELGLALLRDFAKSVRAKATLFTLFLHEPKLIADIAWLFSTSPYLGQLLASRPELLDSFIFRKQAFFTQEPQADQLDQFLEHLADRRVLNELIAASQFLVRRDLRELMAALSSTADEIATSLLERLKGDFKNSQLQILALGKWGGEELGLRSDLDFIFITPNTPNEDDHKVARRFISRISESHKAGAIYAIDLRLRPSGRAGPIISSEALLREYLEQKANVWERQAYLRSRALTGMGIQPAAIAASRGLSDHECQELQRIRQELLVAPIAGLDLKLNSGGFVDVEFTAQIAHLNLHSPPALGPSTDAMIQHLRQVDSRWQKFGNRLLDNYRQLRRIEQLHQLTSQASGAAVSETSESFQRMSRIFGTTPHELYQQIQRCLRENEELLKNLDPLHASR